MQRHTQQGTQACPLSAPVLRGWQCGCMHAHASARERRTCCGSSALTCGGPRLELPGGNTSAAASTSACRCQWRSRRPRTSRTCDVAASRWLLQRKPQTNTALRACVRLQPRPARCCLVSTAGLTTKAMPSRPVGASSTRSHTSTQLGDSLAPHRRCTPAADAAAGVLLPCRCHSCRHSSCRTCRHATAAAQHSTQHSSKAGERPARASSRAAAPAPAPARTCVACCRQRCGHGHADAQKQLLAAGIQDGQPALA